MTGRSGSERSIPERVAALAARQHGLITADQARRIGLTVAQVRGRVASGAWHHRSKGVFAVAGAPATWYQSVLAAVLVGGPGAVASHGTAALLLGCRPGPSPSIEVLTTRGRRLRLAGVVAHRSLLVPPADRILRAGIACTSAARTLVDLAARMDERRLGYMTDDLLRRRLLRLTDLAQCAARLSPAPGRSRRAVEEILAARRDNTGPGESSLEARVIRLLGAAGIEPPISQLRITHGGRRWYLDLAWPAARVAVELDSWTYHRNRSSFDGDRLKGNVAALLGYVLLRFTDSTTDSEIVTTVRAALVLGQKVLPEHRKMTQRSGNETRAHMAIGRRIFGGSAKLGR